MTLHEAIQQILVQEKRALRATDLAEAINKIRLYSKADGSAIKSSQIGARVKNYPHLFLKENGLIRLKSKTGVVKDKRVLKKPVSPTSTLKPSVALKVLMNEKNFKTASTIDSIVPHETGMYCIRIKSTSKLPSPFNKILKDRNHNIIYIGIASQSLKRRLLGQELRSKGHGTFFRSIGAVLGYLPQKGSLKGRTNQNNYKFSAKDTESIIAWINSNLTVNWITCDSETLLDESGLIKKHLPLLNIKNNPSALNELRILREECKRTARL
jgi:hypothetical protein